MIPVRFSIATEGLIVERVGLKRLNATPFIAPMFLAVSELAKHVAGLADRHPVYSK